MIKEALIAMGVLFLLQAAQKINKRD